MITTWEVKNFKSLVDVKLNLSPLTILTGTNSSGKSSLIHSMLLIVQTLSDKVASRSVCLNGPLIQLGIFSDILSSYNNSKPITIGGDIESRIMAYNLCFFDENDMPHPLNYNNYDYVTFCKTSFSMSFDLNHKSGTEANQLLQLQPSIVQTTLTHIDKPGGAYIDEMGETDEDEDLYEDLFPTLTDPTITYVLQRSQNNRGYRLTTQRDNEEEAIEYPKCTLNHFLYNKVLNYKNLVVAQFILKYFEQYAPMDASLLRNVDSAELELLLRRTLPRKVCEMICHLFELARVAGYSQGDTFSFDRVMDKCSSLLDQDWHKLRDQFAANAPDLHSIASSLSELWGEEQLIEVKPPSELSESQSHLIEYFSTSVKHLAPLRERPQSVYSMSFSAAPDELGISGEYTASVLMLYQDYHIWYIPPSKLLEVFTCNDLNDGGRFRQTATLRDAVNDWLAYLGVAEKVEVKIHGKSGYELLVKSFGDDELHDLSNVGVGVSQVLPIIVMCLLAKEDTTMIFEQPELHLHPKVQALLADFFISIIRCNKQCIIETHSDHIINRFCYIAAVGSDRMRRDVGVHFATNGSRGSEFTKVEIDEYGAIKNWPDGFFDQSSISIRETMAAAAAKMAKRRQEKEEKIAAKKAELKQKQEGRDHE